MAVALKDGGGKADEDPEGVEADEEVSRAGDESWSEHLLSDETQEQELRTSSKLHGSVGFSFPNRKAEDVKVRPATSWQ